MNFIERWKKSFFPTKRSWKPFPTSKSGTGMDFDRSDAEQEMNRYLSDYTAVALRCLLRALKTGATIVVGGWVTRDMEEKDKCDRYCVWISPLETEEEANSILSMAYYGRS